MTSMPYTAPIPADPIGDKATLKRDLITQILELQSRYTFQGTQHTQGTLEVKTMRWLEKLCDMQIMFITCFHVPERASHSRVSDTEYAKALSRMNEQKRHRAAVLRGRWPHGEWTDTSMPTGRSAPMGMDGAHQDVRTMRRRMA